MKNLPGFQNLAGLSLRQPQRPIHRRKRRRRDAHRVEAEVLVQVGARAGLAELVHAQRGDGRAVQAAQPGQACEAPSCTVTIGARRSSGRIRASRAGPAAGAPGFIQAARAGQVEDVRAATPSSRRYSRRGDRLRHHGAGGGDLDHGGSGRGRRTGAARRASRSGGSRRPAPARRSSASPRRARAASSSAVDRLGRQAQVGRAGRARGRSTAAAPPAGSTPLRGEARLVGVQLAAARCRATG